MRHSERGQSGLMLPYGVEGRGGCVACLWQVVNGFNGLTDELGSERRAPDDGRHLTLRRFTRTHTNTHRRTVIAKSHNVWLMSFKPSAKSALLDSYL